MHKDLRSIDFKNLATSNLNLFKTKKNDDTVDMIDLNFLVLYYFKTFSQLF